MMNYFTILMTGYNSINWIRKSVVSAIKQNYDNFETICVDAQTTDGTYEVLRELEEEGHIKVIRNTPRQYQVQNIKDGVNMAKDNSIIVSLDFDDWLPHSNILTFLNNIYTKHDPWMTYGTYIEHPYRDVSQFYHAYPDEVINTNSFRAFGRWLSSHLRTFRKELFLKIKDEDLRDEDGDYFKMAGDTAFMYPMLEMSGKKSMYLKEHLYVYNRTNDLSEDKIDINNQERIANLVRSRTPYIPLYTL